MNDLLNKEDEELEVVKRVLELEINRQEEIPSMVYLYEALNDDERILKKESSEKRANEKERQQCLAEGIMIALGGICSELLNNSTAKMLVTSIMDQAAITKEEFENCEDEDSKENILSLYGGELGWIEDGK